MVRPKYDLASILSSKRGYAHLEADGAILLSESESEDWVVVVAPTADLGLFGEGSEHDPIRGNAMVSLGCTRTTGNLAVVAALSMFLAACSGAPVGVDGPRLKLEQAAKNIDNAATTARLPAVRAHPKLSIAFPRIGSWSPPSPTKPKSAV